MRPCVFNRAASSEAECARKWDSHSPIYFRHKQPLAAYGRTHYRIMERWRGGDGNVVQLEKVVKPIHSRKLWLIHVLSQRYCKTGAFSHVFSSVFLSNMPGLAVLNSFFLLYLSGRKTCDVHAKQFNEQQCQCLFICICTFWWIGRLNVSVDSVLLSVELRIFARRFVLLFVRDATNHSIASNFFSARAIGRNQDMHHAAFCGVMFSLWSDENWIDRKYHGEYCAREKIGSHETVTQR